MCEISYDAGRGVGVLRSQFQTGTLTGVLEVPFQNKPPAADTPPTGFTTAQLLEIIDLREAVAGANPAPEEGPNDETEPDEPVVAPADSGEPGETPSA